MILSSLIGADTIVEELKKLNGELTEEMIEPKNGNIFVSYFQGILDGQEKLNQTLGEGFDSSKIDDYALALAGLNDEQKRAVLISAGLTKEQRKEILERTKNTAATKANTAANTENAASDAADTASNTANTASIKADTIETEKNTAAVNANKIANYENAASDVVETGTEVTNTVVNSGNVATQILTLLGSKIKGLGTVLKGIWGMIKGIGSGILALAQAHPLIAGITIAVTALTAVFISQKKAEEERIKAIKEAYEESKTAIKETKDALKDTTSQTDDIKEEYAELAQGVNLLSNENKKLSTEKYERFLELSNQLSSLFPTLTKGYDENGNAILDLSGNVDTIVDSLDNLIARQQQLAHQEIADQMPDLFAGYNQSIDEYEKQVEKAEKVLENIQFDYNVLNGQAVWYDSGQGHDDTTVSMGTYVNALERFGISDDEYEVVHFDSDNDLYKHKDSKAIVGWSRSKAKESYLEQLKKASDDLSYAKQQLEAQKSSINQYLNSWLQTDFSYQQLDGGLQEAVQEIMFDFDFDTLPDTIDKNNWDQVSEYLQRNIIYAVNNCQDEEVSNALSEVFTNTELTPDAKIAFIKQIQSYFGTDHPISVSLVPKLEDTQNVWDQYFDAVSDFGSESYDILNSFFQENSINTLDEIYYWNEITAGAINAAEAIEMYNAACKKADTTNIDALASAQLLSKGFDQLAEIYKDVKDGGNFDYSSILNNDDFANTFGKYEEAYTNFVQTVANSPDDIEACQSAFNGLATEYIYDKTALEEVTEETKNATVAMLEQMGVVNALEIVEAQLIRNTADLESAQEDLNKWKEQGIDLGIDLANATDDELVALKNEAEAASQTNTALYGYVLNKLQARAVEIKTSGDVQQLANFCGSLQIATSAIKKYYEAKEGLANLDANGYTGSNRARMKKALEENLAEAEAEMKNAVTKFQNGEYQVDLNVNLDFNGDPEPEDSTKETYNWIETLISRIQRKVENFGKVVSATYKTWSTRTSAIKDETAALNEELAIQSSAAKKYLEEANKLGLKESYAKLVRNGALQIDDDGKINGKTIDEDTQEKIQKYQEYYEKYLECLDAEQDLRSEIASNYKEAFDNIASEYEAKLNLIEHEASMIEGIIDQTEASGYLVSKNYYENLIALEESTQSQLIAQRSKLQEALNNAMANGIEEGSEDWYNMQSSILEVDEAIQESNTSIIEFKNNIRDLEWEVFDKTQEMISQLHDEKDFLVELMSDEKLFDDNGNWTEYADATVGLHAVSYNTYMAQAEDYAKEIEEINKSLASDPYNQDLLERRQELLEAQRDNILAAEDEKQAMIDLASDGFNAMLDALNELIDKRKEALQAEQDLYNYEKSISDQTKTIASYQKQLEAFGGDDTEETQSKIQQIKVSLEEAQQDLEETEYEQYLSDQEKMLDKLYDNTEQWINERLDDVDALLQGIIESTNANSVSIKETLEEQAAEVGYTLTDEMEAIWTSADGLNGIVTTYTTDFNNQLTSVNGTLTSIRDLIQRMSDTADEQAKENTENPSNGTGGAGSNIPGGTGGGTNTSSDSGTSETDDSWVASLVSQAFKGDKSKLNKDTSIVDRLKYNDFASAFAYRANYYEAMGLGSALSYKGTTKQNKEMIKLMKSKGYKIGSRKIKKDELNWVHDGEIVYRPSDGGMLVPLQQDGKVYTEEMANNLWEIAKTPELFSNLTTTALPRGIVNKETSSNIQNDVVMQINLPNVVDVDGFVNELKTNKKFEKVVQSMTLGNALGGNSLNKYKY